MCSQNLNRISKNDERKNNEMLIQTYREREKEREIERGREGDIERKETRVSK